MRSQNTPGVETEQEFMPDDDDAVRGTLSREEVLALRSVRPYAGLIALGLLSRAEERVERHTE